MPLIVLTGYPSSGKTRRATQLKEHFEKLGKEVHVLSEAEKIASAGLEKNDFYADSRKEKEIRGLVKSEMLRLITPRNVVILDGLNYIKGYRYELYCGTKANHSTQCTIYTIIHQDEAYKLNETRGVDAERYTRETYDALLMRFEEPDGRNRWDAPLFHVMKDAEPDYEAIHDCLFEKKAPPPNMSTQNPPLSSTNFLYEMNKIVKEITCSIIGLIKKGEAGIVDVPGHEDFTIDLSRATVPQIVSLSRQYLTYSKSHKPELERVPTLYIQFLSAHLHALAAQRALSRAAAASEAAEQRAQAATQEIRMAHRQQQIHILEPANDTEGLLYGPEIDDSIRIVSKI